VLVAVNAAIFPTPPDPRPMVVLLFDQLYDVVPIGVVVVKFTAVVRALLQTTWLAG